MTMKIKCKACLVGVMLVLLMSGMHTASALEDHWAVLEPLALNEPLSKGELVVEVVNYNDRFFMTSNFEKTGNNHFLLIGNEIFWAEGGGYEYQPAIFCLNENLSEVWYLAYGEKNAPGANGFVGGLMNTTQIACLYTFYGDEHSAGKQIVVTVDAEKGLLLSEEDVPLETHYLLPLKDGYGLVGEKEASGYYMDVRDEKGHSQYILTGERFNEQVALLNSFSAEDGGLWLPGWTCTRTESDLYYQKIAKVDFQGNLLFQTLLEDPGYQITTSCETEGGGILLAGYFMPGERMIPMISKVNALGEMEWMRHNEQVFSGGYEGIVLLGDHYVLFGRLHSAQGLEAQGQWIDMIDKEGNLVSTYTLMGEINQTYGLGGHNLYWPADEKTIQTIRYRNNSGVSAFTTITLPDQ